MLNKILFYCFTNFILVLQVHCLENEKMIVEKIVYIYLLSMTSKALRFQEYFDLVKNFV